MLKSHVENPIGNNSPQSSHSSRAGKFPVISLAVGTWTWVSFLTIPDEVSTASVAKVLGRPLASH